MPFFPRLPLLFYLGLLPAICVLWLWADSTAKVTAWKRSRSTHHLTVLSAMNSSLVLERFSIIPSEKERPGFPPAGHAPLWGPTGGMGPFRAACGAESRRAQGAHDALPRVGERERARHALPGDDGYPHAARELAAVGVNGLLSAIVAAADMGAGVAAAEEVGGDFAGAVAHLKVGHFLGRFPALFYVGMVPLGVLLGFWSESVINELKWERTPTWSVGEEVTVVDSALRFQRQKILGEEPGQAERYRWHGLWDEAGPEWKFSRVPNRLGTSARTLTRFPAQETSEELRQEEYVQVAVKRVAVPIWMMVCGYVVLWLLLVWWQVWRRRRSLEGVKTAEEDGDRDG